MGGELWAGGVNVVGELARYGLGDGPVELAPPRWTDHLQGDGPKLVVAEIVGEALIAYDSSTPEFVDMVNELVLTDPSGRNHQTNREGSTDHSRHFGQPPGAVG